MNSINIWKSEQTKETITHNEDNSFSQKVENIINWWNKTENIEILYNILSSKLSEKLEDLLRIEYYNWIDTNLIISWVINSFKINKNEIINNILATIEVTKNMNLSIDFEKIIITAIDEIINEEYKNIIYKKYVEFYERNKILSIEKYNIKLTTSKKIFFKENIFLNNHELEIFLQNFS